MSNEEYRQFVKCFGKFCCCFAYEIYYEKIRFNNNNDNNSIGILTLNFRTKVKSIDFNYFTNFKCILLSLMWMYFDSFQKEKVPVTLF